MEIMELCKVQNKEVVIYDIMYNVHGENEMK